MKAVIQDFSELSDSRELLESKPYPAGIYFTYIIIVILVVAIAWASFSDIDVVVKANGIVRPVEKISTITNTVAGKITEVNFENGEFIKEGDIIFKISDDSFDIQKEGITWKEFFKYKDSNWEKQKDPVKEFD